TRRPLTNGHSTRPELDEIRRLNKKLKEQKDTSDFHGDKLLGVRCRYTAGLLANLSNFFDDVNRVFTIKNIPAIATVAGKMLMGKGLDLERGSKLVAALANDSNLRAAFVEDQVKAKYERMLHPPITYLGDAFKYRQADGKFNSALNPHLGQAGAPYAKTVPSKTHPLGSLPDPGDLFDRLMARDEPRQSRSGLSSMLLYHATIIIHDIFRTNDQDKNISDTSSYLDLSPLYGFTEEIQRKVRDDKYKLGLLKPDTFAEDRLLRQPPGVCILLVMYNRYHNYVATQLRRINENNRFAVPDRYKLPPIAAAAKFFYKKMKECEYNDYKDSWKVFEARGKPTKPMKRNRETQTEVEQRIDDEKEYNSYLKKMIMEKAKATATQQISQFKKAHNEAWEKLDDDLFNTARLITCGMYIQISIHDYLRALMGFHQYNTTFTLEPREAINHKNVSRGLGNQVTVEFNLLYRFHCAISLRDEKYTEAYMRKKKKDVSGPHEDISNWDPKKATLDDFAKIARASGSEGQKDPSETVFGIAGTDYAFTRDPVTNLFDDDKMIEELVKSMDEPISNFGPNNVPKCLKQVEVMGILQARKWYIGTLNDFREFFGMKRHESFESITRNKEVQDALRDLYDHPDKVELYPGVFCESKESKDADPGPSDIDSALWAAIFSDAITLVRSDRFYTVDWNTNSLTSWGMKEVTEDPNVLKTSVFHRLVQRAFPEWFPYNSVRFFHPFYTSDCNATYARNQELYKGFKMKATGATKILYEGQEGKTEIAQIYDVPKKPYLPLLLTDFAKIKALLKDDANTLKNIVHPSRLLLKDMPDLPKYLRDVLNPEVDGPKDKAGNKFEMDLPADDEILKYFIRLSRNIIEREAIAMDSKNGVYQIDVIRDFAIPVVTRYVAELLGFSDKIRTRLHPKGRHTEQEIYRHITNCQMFFAYNADETKMIKHRQEFTNSIKFLYDLTRHGHISRFGSWGEFFNNLWPFGKDPSPIKRLGLQIAAAIKQREKKHDHAVAIMLLIGLDSAYNSVVSFAAVLHFFLKEVYEEFKIKGTPLSSPWLQLQKCAFDESSNGITEIARQALLIQKRSVKLPIIRRAMDVFPVRDEKGAVLFQVEKDQLIICDIKKAGDIDAKQAEVDEAKFLDYQSSFTDQYASYHPKHIAALSLTAMIKVLAQMKNLRRSHHDQGHLKKIKLDQSNASYSNYMAPLRLEQIKYERKQANRQKKVAKEKEEQAIQDGLKYQSDPFGFLRPATYTYMTPEWDEMIPFPTTWKLRFDGFGESTYGGEHFPQLQRPLVPDDVPPWYQPRGKSHKGGSFAT
ncbi:heme peroxidase-domain-containing protein, partial [Xylariales sp. PMI_506]